MLNNTLGIFDDIENIIGTKLEGNFNLTKFFNQSIKYIDLLIGSIVITLVGYFAAKLLRKFIKKIGKNAKLNVLITNFISNFLYYTTFIVFFISALNNLGIHTASIATVVGALGVGIGLAFQSSLSNFAAGLLILILRPFKINDLIEVADITGTVTGINTLIVEIKTRDNKIVIIPNSKIISDIMINHTNEVKRRIKFFINLEDIVNTTKAIEILEELAENEQEFLPDHEILVYITEAFEKDKESGLCVECWVKTTDVQKVNSKFKRKIIEKFNQEKIRISFPKSNILI